MPKLIFTVGLPASGKSTWAIKEAQKDTSIIRISRDDLRNMRGTYWVPKQEGLVSRWEKLIAVQALADGHDVIIDATNLSKDRRKAFAEDMMLKGIEVSTVEFHTTVEECIKRDEARGEGKVGEAVIKKMAKQYDFPPRGNKKVDPPEWFDGKPTAIIVDLDGTLATNNTGRGFYDWSRVGEDGINRNVFELVKNMNYCGATIIIMSGRDGSCREETMKWLSKYDVPYQRLFMRQAGDYRKDSIVKKELYNTFIDGEYNIQFTVDDRDQVVDMWRKELGLTCLQVNYGDF